MNEATISKSALWTGRVLSGFVMLSLALDGLMKLAKPAPVLEACAKLGIGEGTITGLGLLLLACTALYAFRRTAVLGALLLTGYLGGASAANLVTHAPTFSLFFPVVIGVLAWGGLALRDARLWAFVPLAKRPDLRRPAVPA